MASGVGAGDPAPPPPDPPYRDPSHARTVADMVTARTDEGKFQAAILDLCKMRGLHVAHFRPGKNSRGKWVTAVAGDGVGYPDLTICGPGGVIWRELKTETGAARPAQRIWLIWLQQAGQDAGIWRPADLTSGLIDATLQNLARPRPWPATPDLIGETP